MPGLLKRIDRCRICGGYDFADVISLGDQSLGGQFPVVSEPDPPQAPLTVMRCQDCGLVQLLHSVEPGQLYTRGYGYRSGINNTMRQHLAGVVTAVCARVPLTSRDVVLDIGCNDGTLLLNYPAGVSRVGIDPLMGKFKEAYPKDVFTAASYFSAAAFRALVPDHKASAITSIAMFYDLEDPNNFVRDIAAILAPDGIWVLEQSYMPRMLEVNSYDTICHEHLEYYCLAQIERLIQRHGLRVFDVEQNDINGGSFRMFVCRESASYPTATVTLDAMRQLERNAELDTQTPYDAFRERCVSLRNELHRLVSTEVARGRRVHVYGASTKGNTILQYCGLNHGLIEAAADRNPEKWGARTPATGIPIVSEEELRASRPDFYLALPWHFRAEFIKREAEFSARGGKFIFPLPTIEVV